ncbi:mas-related G-protein coupled receptor member H-like [Catharus ustulatus]|uniref:mas-related G-protein coupled receptor member H-like n=1 Tax=Catharus ustulatus TaxID=91951 RepID=UPI00140AE7CA|nr:mas-related G-protein coupled receptor member H-like [Catharus ustulatus]XP_032917372.1 mas-related G-protein coupled receptor member H-like [Catharus ustulatus]
MEVTTVSPSPASPTEGDDLCETDFTDVAIHSVALLICLCGLAGNGAVLWLLRSYVLCRNSTTYLMFFLTFFDFLFVLFLVPSPLLFLLEDMSCTVIMPLQHVRLLLYLPQISSTLWLYTLTLISIKRCQSIHCPLWHCCHHPQHLSKVVCALLLVLPITFTTVLATRISLCMSQFPEQCRVSLISMYTFNLLLCVPFMLTFSTILYIKFKSGSIQQQPKSFDIVICLIVLFTLPLSLWNLLQEIGYSIFSSQVFFLLTCIHSSIKPFIYFLAGRCWKNCSVGSLQLSLQRIFEEKKKKTGRRNDASRDTGI